MSTSCKCCLICNSQVDNQVRKSRPIGNCFENKKDNWKTLHQNKWRK